MISLSNRFKDILIKITRSGDEISRYILSLENNHDYNYQFSFIDITSSEDQVSFLQSNKYKQISEDGDHRNINELIWTSSSRNEVKIGRLIIKLAPNFKPTEIENFVNQYKSEYKIMLKNIKFKIVEGIDIIKYYNGRKYDKGSGSLNKSCMRHDQCSDYMDLYLMNPDKIKMLILLDDSKDTLKGRAILWKLDTPDAWLLDRIYTVNDSDVCLFKKHADKNGWLFKNSQTFDAVNVMKNGEDVYVNMKVNIGGNFKYFPYIDTLLYYNKKDNYLTNDEKDYDNNPNIIKLREINGNDSGNENFVYDMLNDTIININDSIYCFHGDAYTHKNNVYFIDKLNEYCLPTILRYSNYYKEFLDDNSVYSYVLESFMRKSDVNLVFLSKDRNNYDYFLKKERNISHALCVNGYYYVIDIMKKGYDDNYYFIDEYDEELIKKLKNKDKLDLEDVIKSSNNYISKLFNEKQKKKISKKSTDVYEWSTQSHTL